MKTLSDKIKKKSLYTNCRWLDGISVSRVKQFIKDLKEEIIEKTGYPTVAINIINELVGDELK